MGEVQDALDQGMLETGVAVITPEMALRDMWDQQKARSSRIIANLVPGEPKTPLRIRLYVDSVHGPSWLRLLARYAWLGGLLQPDAEPDERKPAGPSVELA